MHNDPVNCVDLWGLRTLTSDENDFAILILGTSINGISIDYSSIDIQETSADKQSLENAANGLNINQATKDAVISDMQDPSRGTSLPGGAIFMPGNTSSNLARMVHEIFHQWQYASDKTTLQKVVNEQINYTMGGSDPYDYNTNNVGRITTLSDITTIEGQAQYIEDFANNYQTDKRNGVFQPETKMQAEVLMNSGIKSKAVCEVNNA